jgi:hypothetical protein
MGFKRNKPPSRSRSVRNKEEREYGCSKDREVHSTDNLIVRGEDTDNSAERLAVRAVRAGDRDSLNGGNVRAKRI